MKKCNVHLADRYKVQTFVEAQFQVLIKLSRYYICVDTFCIAQITHLLRKVSDVSILIFCIKINKLF